MTVKSNSDRAYEAEIVGLRDLLTRPDWMRRVCLHKPEPMPQKMRPRSNYSACCSKKLHHRVKNTLAIVIAITSQSLRSASTLEQGRIAVENRLLPWAAPMISCLRQIGPERNYTTSFALPLNRLMIF